MPRELQNGRSQLGRPTVNYFGGGGGGTQTVQTNSSNNLPAWVDQAGQDIWYKAKNIAQYEYLPAYTGQRVASVSDATKGMVGQLAGNVGVGNDTFNRAIGTAQGVSGYAPKFLSGTDLQPYMNPYTQNVIDTSMAVMDQNRQGALNDVRDQAIKSGAFAGSRHGVTEGVTNAQYGLQGAQLAAQLNNQNFQQAQQAALADQQAGLQGQALNLQGAQGAAGLQAAQQANFLQGIQAALQGQGILQGNEQQKLDAAMAQYNEQRQDPVDRLKIQLAAIGGVPYPTFQSSTQTGPGPSSNGLMQGLGGAASLIGMGGTLFGKGGIFPGALAGMFSDRNAKTDIEKLGKDPDSGLDMYAYRYKGDPKSYPKVVGPMAQDIEKRDPDAVTKIGGKRVVRNLGFGG